MPCENCGRLTEGGYCDCMIVDGEFKGAYWRKDDEGEDDNMRCISKKIHVIKDESLGGIKREYVGVIKRYDFGEVEEFEPTEIVHIDGERYRMVDRRAEVGERVIIVTEGGGWYEGKIGEVFSTIDGTKFGFDLDNLRGGEVFADTPENARNSICVIDEGDYRVLVPVESAESPKSVDDIIANLVRRVAQLESELAGAKRDVETWAQEVEGLRNDLAGYRDDYLAIGSAVEDVDAKVEMCIDDIVTLDERTQPKDITISVETLAKLIGGVRR